MPHLIGLLFTILTILFILKMNIMASAAGRIIMTIIGLLILAISVFSGMDLNGFTIQIMLSIFVGIFMAPAFKKIITKR